ncbi:MAG: hypothetical protein HY303_15550 [Candidatus Wallbacteria bacterium]|nr:hypothetical protein [Candidatus Wallbacteria bacterium]
MTPKQILITLAALALTAGIAIAAEPPNNGDIIYRDRYASDKQAAAAPENFDLEKVDYVLAEDHDGGPTFEDLHSRVMGALAAEQKKGNPVAAEAATELAGMKVTADKALEDFLARASELKKLTGYDVVASGTAGLAPAIAALSATDSARAKDLELGAGRAAQHVIAARGAYRRRATELAAKVLNAR